MHVSPYPRTVTSPGWMMPSSSIAYAQVNKTQRYVESVDLQVSDLVMWTGRVTEFSTMSRRVVYRVVERKDPTDESNYVQYRFSPAFDLESPIGSSLDVTPWMTAREMKRLGLLDLGTMRLHFDNFIREWAKRAGEPDVDEVR